jgi:hypothetical protein
MRAQHHMTPHFEQCAEQPQAPLPSLPYDRWPDANGDDALLFCRLPGGFLLRFPDRADFVVMMETGAVRCAPVPGASPQMITALYLNQVLPLMMNHAGTLVLHAAAINDRGRALAFAGASGFGKSTLAASFAKTGYPFLTDDGLILEPADAGYLARPSHASVRLWLDSELALFNSASIEGAEESVEKSRLISGPGLPHQKDPIPLAAIYFLGDGDTIEFQKLTPQLGLSCLIQHAFLLDADDRARVRAHFGRLADLSEMVPMFTLNYPRQYERLHEVIDRVLDHSRQGANAS